MMLVRVWRRRLYGGMGAATIVPGAMLGALAVLVLAGGFARLPALGQILSGPPAPAAATVSGHGVHASRPLSAGLVAALSAVPAAQRAPGNSAPAPAANGVAPTSSGTTPAGPPTSVVAHYGPGGGGTRPRSPGQPPPPAPKPQPTVIDGIVATGTSVTQQAPGPAGPAATGALQSAGSTLDSIAPIRSR